MRIQYDLLVKCLQIEGNEVTLEIQTRNADGRLHMNGMLTIEKGQRATAPNFFVITLP